jgi:NAD(P)-dependent dehydrogenase (short-subunit alcohol dehydrogenase family)
VYEHPGVRGQFYTIKYVIPEPISSDPWQNMENQPFPTLSVISDRSELSGIGIIPHFLGQGGGCIVNMASLSSYPPFTAAADYSASKAAVKRLTESVAYEYAGDNIRANAVAPGHIETPIYRGLEDHKAKMAQRIPLGRFGEPEEVASVVLMLATDDTSYVTGQTIMVDGGHQLS